MARVIESLDNNPSQRWAIAILLFVDSKILDLPCESNDTIAGSKHFLVFHGTDAEAIYAKAHACAADLEKELTAGAASSFVQEVRGALGPYLPTKFLGFQDIKWSLEAILDGAIVYCGPIGGEGSTNGGKGFEITRRNWYGVGSWCLAEIVAEFNSKEPDEALECFLIFHASGPDDAVEKATRLAAKRQSICGQRVARVRIRDISMIDDITLEEDSAELLYYTARSSAARWRRLVRHQGKLSIFDEA